MVDDQKQNEISPEELEKKREALFKEYKKKPYWTFGEGVFLIGIHRGPLCYIAEREWLETTRPVSISEKSFDNILRASEIGRFGHLDSLEEIKKIISDYRECIADLERTQCRTQIGEWDLFPKFDLKNKIYNTMKVDPLLFIQYAEENPDIFSETEIPPGLENIFNKPVTEEGKNSEKDIPLETRLDKLIKEVTPELDLFYVEVKAVAKNAGRNTQDLRYDDGTKAFENKKEPLKVLESDDIKKDFFGSDKPSRDIKGGLIRKIVLRKIPELISNHEGIKIDAQALYQRMNNLKPS